METLDKSCFEALKNRRDEVSRLETISKIYQNLNYRNKLAIEIGRLVGFYRFGHGSLDKVYIEEEHLQMADSLININPSKDPELAYNSFLASCDIIIEKLGYVY